MNAVVAHEGKRRSALLPAGLLAVSHGLVAAEVVEAGHGGHAVSLAPEKLS